jgi:hypothetical protein
MGGMMGGLIGGGGWEREQWETTPNDAGVVGEDKDLDDNKDVLFLVGDNGKGPRLADARLSEKGGFAAKVAAQ